MAIQLRRRIGSPGAPTTLAAGQLAYLRPVAAGATPGPDDLYVGDGTAVHPLVSNTRQVELDGAQTIVGAKTIAVGNFHLTGGTSGQLVQTDGSGNLSFTSAVQGPLQFAGTYDAATHEATPIGGAAGPLPAPNGNRGHVYIVDEAGTGAAPAPVVAMSVGDWLVSTGTAWLHLDLHQPATIAANVSVSTITGMTATDVQGALAEIFAGLPVAVATTITAPGGLLTGNGTTASPLSVLSYDDGTW